MTSLRELLQSMSRNKSMTLSLVVTMSVSLLLASLGLLMQSQANRTEKYFGDRLQLQVNLCTENSPGDTCTGGAVTDDQKRAIQQALRSNSEVARYEVRSPADQYETAKLRLGQSETGRKQLETIGPESFPESYLVTLADPEEYDSIKSQTEGMDGVGGVTSFRELLGALFEFLEKIKYAALGTSLLLLVAAILQVSNAIRLAAFARRREIGIMRLVGASAWHIQLPFILESLIAALLSAALACLGLAAFMHFVVYGYLRETLGGVTTWVSWGNAAVVMGLTTVFALLLALVPTIVMTRKYLDV